MKAPVFWNQRKPTTTAKFLSPIAKLYSAITGYHLISTTPYDAVIPVVCVGNYTMGGAGKTPTTQSVFHMISDLGFNPCVLSRGYGGLIKGPKQVNPEIDTPQQVGDEPFMMAHHIPVVVSRDRVKGANFIIQQGFNVILMDDGFQNPSLKKDISLIVIDAAVMLGNEKTFPSGPLREPLDRAIPRTDALVIIGDKSHEVSKLQQVKQQFTANIHPDLKDLPKEAIAFCGIGRPEKFENTLLEHGVKIAELIDYPDHHPYTESELDKLGAKAEAQNLPLITTEKDWVKLPKIWQERIQCLPIKLEWDRPEDVKAFLKAKLAKI